MATKIRSSKQTLALLSALREEADKLALRLCAVARNWTHVRNFVSDSDAARRARLARDAVGNSTAGRKAAAAHVPAHIQRTRVGGRSGVCGTRNGSAATRAAAGAIRMSAAKHSSRLPLATRFASWAFRGIVRAWPADTRDWARGMQSELTDITDARESLRWLQGGVMSLTKAWWNRALFGAKSGERRPLKVARHRRDCIPVAGNHLSSSSRNAAGIDGCRYRLGNPRAEDSPIWTPQTRRSSGA